MHYKLYSTEDFIQDDFFQQWVLSPNEESTRYWTNFLLYYPAQQTKVEEAREFLLSMNFERAVPEAVIEEIRRNVNTAIDDYEFHQSQTESSSGRSPKRGNSRALTLWLVSPLAASVLLLGIFIGYSILQQDAAATLFEPLKEENAAPGERRHIVLADGSQVWLNADSRIRYPDVFGSGTREIYLEGEAFFDIARNEDKPFVVHTSGLSIKVLGTAFNVRSYEKDSVVETTLVEGKVSIESVQDDSLLELTLLPNQQGLYRKNSRTLAIEDTVKTHNYVAWKNGWMIFDDKPFGFIKETMERWYDVSIHMDDETSLSCTYSARFKDKTLQEVLEIFRNTESIQYRIEGKQVFISGKLCQYQREN